VDALRRRLTLGDAVVVGAGSMVGAGAFAVWSPAAAAAGTWLLPALGLAAVVAGCNATSSAQLAAAHPESGGTYVYGRERLGPAWGHLAGWGFVVGKTASCAAMALTVGAYLWPARERAVAVAAVALIAVVNLRGITRTVAITRVLLVVALLALGLVVVAGVAAGPVDPPASVAATPGGVLEAAGLLFFAFAGYARIATMGEEVIDPAVTIPKAIPRALLAVVALYAVVGAVALRAVGPVGLAATDAPLAAVVAAGPLAGAGPVVAVGAGIAALGVLLNLMAGVSRTALAMARRGELPRVLARIDGRHAVPAVAEVVLAVVVTGLVLVVDLRGAIGLSGVAVLTYYAVTNAAALTLRPEERRWSPALARVGLVGCTVLALSLPPRAVVVGLGVLALGVVVRLATRRGSGQEAG
jgi:APA family basic amino acid/polyamine antiporter